MSRILFFLGSGTSIPAPMPSVADIDRSVRAGVGLVHEFDEFKAAGDAYFKHSSGSYLPWNFQNPDEDDWRRGRVASTCVQIVNVVWRLIEEGFGDGWPATTVNYETVYSVISMLADDLQNVRNPAVWPMLRRVKAEVLRECPTLLSGVPGEYHIEVVKDLEWWLRESCGYIEDVVCVAISKSSEDAATDHLAVFTEIADREDLTAVDFVTTNHDPLLERRFVEDGPRRSLYSGFRPIAGHGDLREWTPDSRRARDEVTESHLLKLHGSIDWWTDLWAGNSRIIHPSPRHLAPPRDDVRVHEERPVILTGTISKMIRYSAGIFIDHLNEYLRVAHEADHIVICGYGLGDPRLNRVINERAGNGRPLRLTICHRHPDDLRRRADNASAHSLLTKDGIEWVEKWLGGHDPLTMADLNLG